MYARTLLFIGLLFVSAVAVATPKIQHWTLTNGARVYFVETHELPMLQIRTVFDAGSSRDPADKAGLARLTSAMLDEGAGSLTADDIARQFEGLGAEFGAGVDRDMASVSLRSLSDASLLEPALDLFARVLSTPSFPQASLERLRAQALVALQKEAESPGAVAGKAFYHELYGEHPYAHDPRGDQASLKAITREDLAAYHRDYYVGANAWLVIVGDAGMREARSIAERIIGQLPAGHAPVPLPPVRTLHAPQQKKISFPATQTHILQGQPGMSRGDPDYFPLYVGNYILGGGGFASRLMNEVREKKGLAYSVYSYFMPLKQPGEFQIGLQTKKEQADEALKLVRDTLKYFIAKGPTEKELLAAKDNIIGGFPLRIDSNRKILGYLSVIGFYGLPLTYLDDFTHNIDKVTIAQIREAFKRHIDPQAMATVIVGAPEEGAMK